MSVHPSGDHVLPTLLATGAQRLLAIHAERLQETWQIATNIGAICRRIKIGGNNLIAIGSSRGFRVRLASAFAGHHMIH